MAWSWRNGAHAWTAMEENGSISIWQGEWYEEEDDEMDGSYLQVALYMSTNAPLIDIKHYNNPRFS